MDIELITWLKGGEYRIKVLEILSKNRFLLPSEIASLLNVHRSSISRILSDLKEKELIQSTESSSRTTSYSITKLGIKLFSEINQNG